jgi:hypothetical protein
MAIHPCCAQKRGTSPLALEDVTTELDQKLAGRVWREARDGAGVTEQPEKTGPRREQIGRLTGTAPQKVFPWRRSCDRFRAESFRGECLRGFVFE